MSEANSLQSSGVPRQRRRQSTSEGAAARAAKMTELIDETTRSDGHASLLCGELSKAEHEVSWLAAALQTAKDAVAHAERTTEQHQQHYEIEFEASKRLRLEISGLQDEYDALATRMKAAQKVNEEWQERVQMVSADFEARSAEWRDNLDAANGKWRSNNESLQQQLGKAEEQNAADASRIQQLVLGTEKLESKLQAAQEDAAEMREDAKAAHAAEAEVQVRPPAASRSEAAGRTDACSLFVPPLVSHSRPARCVPLVRAGQGACAQRRAG